MYNFDGKIMYLCCDPLVRKLSGVLKSFSGKSNTKPPTTGVGSFLKDVVEPEEPNSFCEEDPRKFDPVETASS